MNRTRRLVAAALTVGLATSVQALAQSDAFRYYLCYTTGGDDRQQGNDWGSQLQFDDWLMDREAVILYQHHLGNFPRAGVHMVYSTPTYMQDHLARVAWAVDKFVPNPDFSGVAIIDYEIWRCEWDRTPNVPSPLGPDAEDRDFKDDWRDHVLMTYPHFKSMSPSEQEDFLRDTYEQACADFYLATLRLCQEMRPKAKWGFYGYPSKIFKHQTDTPKNVIGYGDHTHRASQINDRLRWMWEAVDALFPSYYAPRYTLLAGEPSQCPNQEASREEDREFLRSNVAEARRLSKGKPVYAVSWLRYHTPNKGCRFYEFLNEINLRNQFEVPYLAGADGVVLWGNLLNEADYLSEQAYFDRMFIPTLADIMLTYGLYEGGDGKAGGDGGSGDGKGDGSDQGDQGEGDGSVGDDADAPPPPPADRLNNSRGGGNEGRGAVQKPRDNRNPGGRNERP